ncbi:S8 family peptidase [Paenibacillus athensensis]|uniref:Peptidase S8 n=1 Tax=Paenibacillus athensensis TaxID=1967502 RepID=A0A4Y8QAH7_9BACL|nr:S8 family peptidase [Paenibacillus athensensis]MCD1259974.1 S8 family peptidase [Paenibacillus athensensis]
MRTAAFLQWLHDEVGLAGGAPGSAKRHIVRFRSSRDYAACRAGLRRLKPVLARLSARPVRELDLIRGFSCMLSDLAADRLQEAWGLEVEDDLPVRVRRMTENRPASSIGRSGAPTPIVPWGIGHIQAPEAWSRSVGQRVRVGVIDTGIDYNHPDLRHSIANGINLVHRAYLPFDDNGHGTHIAGTIAASSRGGGIIGVAPKALIHPVKAFDHNGSAYVSDIIAGILWCVDQDLDVINMSFGMKTYSRALEQAVLRAYNAGKIIVASSGNDGKRTVVDYPARFPQTLAVGATTRSNRIAPFSNRGRRIDLYAPGERIYSAWLHGKYNELSGTSMATAHVSGVIALMLSVNGGLRPAQIKKLLKRTASALGKSSSARWKPGQLNARRALSALKSRDV